MSKLEMTFTYNTFWGEILAYPAFDVVLMLEFEHAVSKTHTKLIFYREYTGLPYI